MLWCVAIFYGEWQEAVRDAGAGTPIGQTDMENGGFLQRNSYVRGSSHPTQKYLNQHERAGSGIFDVDYFVYLVVSLPGLELLYQL